jgi:hypothetical protein
MQKQHCASPSLFIQDLADESHASCCDTNTSGSAGAFNLMPLPGGAAVGFTRSIIGN